MMPDILLATINARYTHAALGLRYLWANLGPERERAAIREFISVHNEDPKPFVWTRTADQILDSIARYAQRTVAVQPS
jgi:hypothetical protein